MAGLFISFEGIDKSGKSTQAGLLVDHLQGIGHEVVFTHEPGGTELGQEIRHLALTWKPQRSQGVVDPAAEIFLFAADRAQHVAEVIQPALAEKEVDIISILDVSWAPLWILFPSLYTAMEKRYSILLRPFGPGAPQEFPASFARYPLSRYSVRGLVYNLQMAGEKKKVPLPWLEGL